MVIPVPATLPDSVLSPAAIASKFQSSSLAGLGSYCDDNPDECYSPGADTGGGTLDLCAIYPAGCLTPPSGTNAIPGTGGGGGIPSDDSGGTDWTSILKAMVKSGTDLSKLYLITPGTTMTAGGAISRQNPGYSIPGQGGVTGNLNVGGIGTGTLLIGLGLLAFMFMQQGKH